MSLLLSMLNCQRTLLRKNNAETDEEEEVDISGTKVRAPYRTSWGTLEYHNAMVVCPEEPEGEEARVWLLYLHPTNKSMKPCGFYLEVKCCFMDNCRDATVVSRIEEKLTAEAAEGSGTDHSERAEESRHAEEND
ncbi:hypothetical protein cypCar_00040396 [Cyprinus carpio]|nr:hypothetical protein cypCar_00040396 [Cyprinus carpio]